MNNHIKKRNNTLIREFWRWTSKCLWFQTVLKNAHTRRWTSKCTKQQANVCEQRFLNEHSRSTVLNEQRFVNNSLISGFVNENEDEHSRTSKCTNGFSMGLRRGNVVYVVEFCEKNGGLWWRTVLYTILQRLFAAATSQPHQ